MATSVENYDHAFRRTLLCVGKELTTKDCLSLKFLYKTKNPIRKNQPGLEMLDELMTLGLFNKHQPDQLSEILTCIDRQDLANLVSDYYQQTQKQGHGKKNGRWGNRTPADAEIEKSQARSNMLPVTLVTVLNINCHTLSLIEEAEKELQSCSKKETAAIVNVKKDFKRLKESLKKAIAAFTQNQMESDNQTDSVARDSKGGSGPVPSGKLPNLSALAKSTLDLSSLLPTWSGDKDVKLRHAKSTEEILLQAPSAVTETPNTDHKNFSAASLPSDSIWGRVSPPQAKSTKRYARSFCLDNPPKLDVATTSHHANNDDNGDDSDYENPWYAELNAHTMDKSNIYSEPRM